jgi:hypothetical protein
MQAGNKRQPGFLERQNKPKDGLDCRVAARLVCDEGEQAAIHPLLSCPIHDVLPPHLL